MPEQQQGISLVKSSFHAFSGKINTSNSQHWNPVCSVLSTGTWSTLVIFVRMGCHLILYLVDKDKLHFLVLLRFHLNLVLLKHTVHSKYSRFPVVFSKQAFYFPYTTESVSTSVFFFLFNLADIFKIIFPFRLTQQKSSHANRLWQKLSKDMRMSCHFWGFSCHVDF